MRSPARYITTKLVVDMTSGEELVREGYWYFGPVEECKGASDEQKEAQQKQAEFADKLATDYSTQFGKQSAITDSLHASLAPVIAAGPNQYGFSNAEDATRRTQATAGTAAAFRSAKQSLGETQAAQGGGDEFLASGTKVGQNQALATAAAQSESDKQLGITSQGYEVGRQQYNQAVGQDSGVAGVINPNGVGSLTTGAQSSAYNEAEENQKMNNASSPWGTIGGILGGVAGAFAGPLGASIGSKIGSSIGGAASGSGGGEDD